MHTERHRHHPRRHQHDGEHQCGDRLHQEQRSEGRHVPVGDVPQVDVDEARTDHEEAWRTTAPSAIHVAPAGGHGRAQPSSHPMPPPSRGRAPAPAHHRHDRRHRRHRPAPTGRSGWETTTAAPSSTPFPAAPGSCSTGSGRPPRPVATGAARRPRAGNTANPASTSQSTSTVPRLTPRRSVAVVVQPVVGRRHDHVAQWSEGPGDVRVRHRAEHDVADEHRRRHGAAGPQDDEGQCGQLEAGVHEGVGAERGEDAQLLLRVVQRVIAPEGADAVVEEVRSPVGEIHEHQHRHHERPAGQAGERVERHPAIQTGQRRRRAGADERHRGDGGCHVEREVRRVLPVAGGAERARPGPATAARRPVPPPPAPTPRGRSRRAPCVTTACHAPPGAAARVRHPSRARAAVTTTTAQLPRELRDTGLAPSSRTLRHRRWSAWSAVMLGAWSAGVGVWSSASSVAPGPGPAAAAATWRG